MINRIKKILLIFFLMGLSQPYYLDDNKALKKKEGILFFEIEFLQDISYFSKIDLVIYSKDKEEITISLKSNQKNHFIFLLKEGTYSFKEIKAYNAEEAFKESQASSGVDYYKGDFLKNAFKVKSQNINYLGKIELYHYHRKKEKYFDIYQVDGSKRIIDKKRFFFYNIYSPKNIEWLKKSYPNQSKNYPILKTKMLYEKDLQASEGLDETDSFYGYAKENYGIDEKGYQNWKWGLFYKDILKKEKEKWLSISWDSSYEEKINYEKKYNLLIHPLDWEKGKKTKQNYLILSKKKIENKRYEENQQILYFSPIKAKKWEKKLYQVTLYTEKDYNFLMDELIRSYGFPRKENKLLRWTLPETVIFFEDLRKQKNNLTAIHYLSRKYYEIMNLVVGND